MTKDATSLAVLEAFTARYKETFYAELAQARIDELKKQQATKAETERQRLAMLQQEEGRKRAGAETAKPLPGGDPLALARSLQIELKRVGCDPGGVDGVWAAGAREALAEFMRLAKLSLPAEPTAAALDAVSAQKERVCPIKCEKGETAVGGRCVAKASSQPRTVQKAPAKSSETEDSPSKGKGVCWALDGRNSTATFCK